VNKKTKEILKGRILELTNYIIKNNGWIQDFFKKIGELELNNEELNNELIQLKEDLNKG
jgi:hypothetical protein